jgi:hypothetical protein
MKTPNRRREGSTGARHALARHAPKDKASKNASTPHALSFMARRQVPNSQPQSCADVPEVHAIGFPLQRMAELEHPAKRAGMVDERPLLKKVLLPRNAPTRPYKDLFTVLTVLVWPRSLDAPLELLRKGV